MSFNYRMVKCSRCGSTSALEYGICQRCGHQLKKPNTASMFVLGVGAAALVIALMSLVIYLTRDTVIGGLLTIGIAVLSIIFSIGAYIWFVVNAFRASPMWGMAVIFLPTAQIAFVYKHADKAIVPFSLFVLGVILALIASFYLP
jgi:hypothetical protein